MRHAWYILPSIAAVLLAFTAVFWGCGKGEGGDGVDSSAAEQELIKNLEGKRAERLVVADARTKAVREMESLVAKARTELAKRGIEKPSDDELKAEIEGHPDAYPGWKELYAQVEKLNGDYSAKLKEAQDAVREKMLREHRVVPGVPAKK